MTERNTQFSRGIKRGFMLLVLIAGVAAALPAINGREVIENVEDKPSGDTMHSLVQMTLIDSSGSEKQRLIENWSKESQEGNKSIIVFHKPASVENTRFLTVENPGRDDDQWIYLPALGRVRRIAASEGDSSFMGTDFTYDDMQSRDVEESTYTLLREERAQGRDCYVVESVPKESSDSQYSRQVAWVAKEIWVPVRVDFYDKQGELFKRMTVSRIERVQGFWTPINTTMKNLQTGHSTKLDIQRLEYNEELQDGLFTVNFLKTGRP
ncbi:MAG: outer membrane lipoprotein-sorting protein [Spirochaetales bacterium]|nr:outer membrane lipoprotein-sorting protein [Spirochaetales bacterium]MCF7938798.1 outer membrane lipoprotein-sorting protein [Spirochaetales bacterium]